MTRFASVHHMVLVATLGAVAACSGGDKVVAPGENGGGGGGGGGNTVLVAEDSAFLAQSTSGYALTEFNALRDMGKNGTAPTLSPAGAPAGCVTTTGGADANRNGIPDDQTQTFNATACTITSNGATNVVSGSVRLQDLPGILGYRLTFTNFKISAATADTTVSITLTGTREASFTDNRNGRTVNTSVMVLDTRSRTGTVTLTIAQNLTGTFVATSNFAPRAAFPGGAYTVTGNFTVGIALAGDARPANTPASASFTVAVNTTRVLNFDGFCSSQAAFNNGELAGQVSGYSNGPLAVRFTSCGNGTTTPPTTKKSIGIQ